MLTRLLALAALVAAQPAVAQIEVPEAEAASLAVLPLRIDRLQGNTATRLDLLLRARVEKRSRMQVQSASTTASLVEAAQSLGVECELVTVACAVEFGAVADVEHVLLGIAAGYGAETGIDLRLVDVARGVEVARGSMLLPADFGQEAARLGVLVEVLFAAAAHPLRTGLGRVDASRVLPVGATVTVDGAPRGQAPFDSPINDLVPGPHVVTVQLDGYESAEVRFETSPSDTYTLDVVLVLGAGPRQKTALERALPWTVAGAGAGLLLGGAATMAIGALPWLDAAGAQGELDALIVANSDAAGADFAGDAAALNTRIAAQQLAWQSWGLPALVVGGVVAVAGGVVAAGGGTWALLDRGEMTE